jgi:hypothetical protein
MKPPLKTVPAGPAKGPPVNLKTRTWPTKTGCGLYHYATRTSKPRVNIAQMVAAEPAQAARKRKRKGKGAGRRPAKPA